MNNQIHVGLVGVWIPVVLWLLIFEFIALINGHGFTLSEAVWWLVWDCWHGADRKTPPQVCLAICLGWLPPIALILCTWRITWASFEWLWNVHPHITTAVIFALLAHFFWQRYMTYNSINDSEWKEWQAYKSKGGK